MGTQGTASAGESPPSSPESLQVPLSSTWVNFYGAARTSDRTPLPVETTVTAIDPDGVVCGVAVVHTEGQYGLLACYGDDPTTPEDEGAQPGGMVRLVVDGQMLGRAVWTAHGDLVEVNLGAEGVRRPWRVYLPLVRQGDR